MRARFESLHSHKIHCKILGQSLSSPGVGGGQGGSEINLKNLGQGTNTQTQASGNLPLAIIGIVQNSIKTLNCRDDLMVLLCSVL